MASPTKILSGASASEISQAQGLIARGKIGATQGDPRLSRIITALQSSSREQIRQSIREAEKRGEDISKFEVTEARGTATITKPAETITPPPSFESTSVSEQAKQDSLVGKLIREEQKQEQIKQAEGTIFFTKEEATARGITTTPKIVSATAKKTPVQIAEEVLQQKDSGAVGVSVRALDIVEGTRLLEKRVAERTTIPVSKFVESKIGVDIPTLAGMGALIPTTLIDPLRIVSPEGTRKVQEFKVGFQRGIVEDIIHQPVQNLLTFGVGFGVGVGIQTVKQTVTIGKISSRILKAGGIGLGATFVGATVMDVVQAQTIGEKGAITGVAVKDFALFMGGARVGGKFVATEIIRIPTRPIEEPTFMEISRVALFREKPVKLSAFTIKGETRPPIQVLKTSQIRRVFNVPDKIIKELPARKFVVKSDLIVGEGKFGVLQKVGKGKVVSSIEIAGSHQEINIKDLTGSTNIQKFLSTRLGEKITGVPTSTKNVGGILSGEGSRFFTSAIESKQLTKIQLSKGFVDNKLQLVKGLDPAIVRFQKNEIKLDLPAPGKSILRSETLSRIKFIAESPELRVSKIDLVFKDVTLPGARPLGKTPGLKGTLFEIKEPLVIESGKQISNILQKADIVKTPFAKTLGALETKQQVKTILPAQTSKAIIRGQNIQTTSGLKTEISQVSPMKSITPVKSTTITQNIQTVSPQLKAKQDIGTTQKFISTQMLGSIQQTKQQQKLDTVQKLKSIQSLKAVQQLKQPVALKSPQKLKTSPKLSTALLQRLGTSITPLTIITIPSYSKPPRSKTPKPPRLRFSEGTFSLGGKGKFSVAVRRFGKFRTIGTGLSISKAIETGRGRVARTLGATFKLTAEGKGISTKGIATPKGFKRKKGLTFIEAPRLRLSTGTEVKEIQIAKAIQTQGGIKT